MLAPLLAPQHSVTKNGRSKGFLGWHKLLASLDLLAIKNAKKTGHSDKSGP